MCTFKDYTSRYCNPKETNFGMDYNGNSCTKELHYILSNSLMIRRLKKEVLKELPDKRRQKIEVAVDKRIQTEINRILNGFDADPSALLKTQLQ